MNKLLFSNEAISDLDETFDYILYDLENPSAANNTIDSILKTIDKLKDFPKLGPSMTDIVDYVNDYRYIVCQNHIAFYRIGVNCIYIDRILYKRRDYLRVLFNEIYE